MRDANGEERKGILRDDLGRTRRPIRYQSHRSRRHYLVILAVDCWLVANNDTAMNELPEDICKTIRDLMLAGF